MKKIILGISTFLCAVLLSSVVLANESTPDLSMYPEAQTGFERHVIILPAIENEQDAKVELLIGETLLVDQNIVWFGGNLIKKTVEGWGYSYLVVEELTGPFTTLMASLPGSEEYRFITIPNLELQRYNSRLPLVVYVPEGTQVKYRVWIATDPIQAAEIR